MAEITMKQLSEILEKIQAQLGALSERVEQIERAQKAPALVAGPRALPAPKETPPATEKLEIAEEELIAVSAALAAYLGVRVRIRQIRLLSSPAWAQQGRVSIQASHNLHG